MKTQEREVSRVTFDDAVAILEARQSGNQFIARCPAHEDRNPSLSLTRGDNGELLAFCHAGCPFESILDAIRTKLEATQSKRGLTVAEYAAAKKLPESFLREQFELNDTNGALEIPYFDGDDFYKEYLRSKMRPSMDKKAHQMWWTPGDRTLPYGIWRICDDRVVICEGESDTHTLAFHGIPAIGISGAEGWKDEFAKLPCFEVAKTVYVVKEHDEAAEKFVRAIAASPLGPKVAVVTLPVKDPSELHIQNPAGFKAEWEKAIAAAQKPQTSVATEDVIGEEALPEFPRITGSIHEFADALCPDLPYELKVMAAITRVGLALSGQVHLDGELYLQPRFYTCFIAEAGRGKTAAIKETRVLNFGYHTVPSVDSAPALVDAFAEHSEDPRRLLLAPDEAVDLFEKAKTSRDSRNSLFTELLKLYEDNVTGNRARRNGSPIEIDNAHLAILCGATPSGYDAMWTGSRGASGGLQSRFVPIITTAPPIPQKQRPSDSERVRRALERIERQITGCWPTLITMTPEAEEAFAKWWRSSPRMKPSEVRVESIVKRFLMVLAVTNDVHVIDTDLLAIGTTFGDYVIAVRERFNPADAVSWTQHFEKKIEAVHERAAVPITRNQCRRLLHPDRYPGGYGEFVRAYSNLIQAGRLVAMGKSERDVKYALD